MNENILSSAQGQVVMAGMVVWLLQFLKDSKRFPFLDRGTDTLNRWIGVIMASVAGTGFTIVHTGNLFDGGQLVIAYPSLLQLGEWAVHTGFQYMSQQAIYHGYSKPKEAAKIVEENATKVPAPPVQYQPKPVATAPVDSF